MARVTRITTVCDGCGGELEVRAFRVGGSSGNTKPVDLCETCEGKPFAEVLSLVGAIRGTRGRRPGTTTPEMLEKIKADRAAAEAVAADTTPAPRKRAARKVAAAKAE
jgi:hypothetical protein